MTSHTSINLQLNYDGAPFTLGIARRSFHNNFDTSLYIEQQIEEERRPVGSSEQLVKAHVFAIQSSAPAIIGAPLLSTENDSIRSRGPILITFRARFIPTKPG
ncbi:hypothetical protein FRC02_010549 [Tulasnella sp. 418]|nr:hypothetical protein FRC02_010549 [Tulasnella sp. 418]